MQTLKCDILLFINYEHVLIQLTVPQKNENKIYVDNRGKHISQNISSKKIKHLHNSGCLPQIIVTAIQQNV